MSAPRRLLARLRETMARGSASLPDLVGLVAHELVADAFLGEHEPDLPGKRAERELEELPHGGAALAGLRA